MNAGDRLELTAAYDNGLPHTRVMSIMMAYLAPGETEPCAETPDDVRTQVGKPGSYSFDPVEPAVAAILTSGRTNGIGTSCVTNR